MDGLLVVPGKRESPLVSAWAGESVYLLDPSKREEDHEEDDGARVLHFVYGQPVTCLDVSACRAALGVKSCGWGMNDGGNKVSGFTCTKCYRSPDLRHNQCEEFIVN